MKVEMLDILSNLMQVWNLQLLILSPEHRQELARMDLGLRKWLTPETDWKESFCILQSQIPDRTLLYARDIFDLNYALFRLPDREAFVSIGPWITNDFDFETLIWPGELTSDEDLPTVRHFYQGIRRMDPEELENSLTALISGFFPENKPDVRHVNEEMPFTFRLTKLSYPEPIFWESMTIENMEQHWKIKMKILQALESGKSNEAISQLLQHTDYRFYPSGIGNRYTEKTELLLVNSLFLETAIKAKVHPVYVQELFDHFAERILNQRKTEYSLTIQEMIREYCECIQKWTLAPYSEPVRVAIDTMRFQLKETPTPSMLAKRSGLSLRQLNRRFRQETGLSMMEYLSRERIRAATIALETSSQSIGQIAESVGIIDANYFSRLFRKYMGQTPTQYRQSLFRHQRPQ